MKNYMMPVVQVLLSKLRGMSGLIGVALLTLQLVGVTVNASTEMSRDKKYSGHKKSKMQKSKSNSGRKAGVSNPAKLGNLSTDVRFDGSAVHGKFQTAADGVATVEDDKYLDDLLGVRKSFADRELANKARN